MIKWKTPAIEDIPEMKRITAAAGSQGSDICAANIFLLREKYNIKTAFSNGTMFRLYTGTRLPGRIGVAFPVGGDTEQAFGLIREYFESISHKKRPVPFVYLTEEQRDRVSSFFPELIFDTYEGNSDYLYKAADLSALDGKEYIKKRNRVNHFCREYPDWEIRYFDSSGSGDFIQDIIRVEEKWFSLLGERVDSVFVERLEVYEACRYWKELNMTGAVMYVGGEAVAMSMASEISPGYYDIHFEKCYGDFAQAGGFAVINKYFTAYLMEHYGAEWINREEDIGLEGLRRAKRAYHPDRMLTKYHTKV